METAQENSTVREEVERLTQLGSSHLQQGSLKEASEAFEAAFQEAARLGCAFTERTCAFNLGAVYIAQSEPEKGLELLRKAVPPLAQKDGKSNGDLYYNFGIGFESLQNQDEAVKYYELSLEEYQSEKDNSLMEAQSSAKLGALYKQLGDALQAARAYGIASDAHGQLLNHEQQAICMCQQALQLLHAGKIDDVVDASDDCMVACQNVKQGETLGRLYNELGLIYTQTGEYNKAATCFELALPLCRGPKGDKRRQAVILQNLGAVYNSLGDYQRALSFHENAAAAHAELGNRNAQGQCFSNLAFAYSQMGDNESAGECYLHALQASKDTGDKHAQWQALEGLGAVAFNEGHLDKAVKYFKKALGLLVAGENNTIAQERIVAKLTDSLQCQLSKGPVKPMLGNQPKVMVRPPTREDLAILDVRSQPNTSKIPNDFDRIAIGIGAYESESDLSLMHIPHNLPPHRNLPSTSKYPRMFEPVSSGMGMYCYDTDASLKGPAQLSPRYHGNKNFDEPDMKSTLRTHDLVDDQGDQSRYRKDSTATSEVIEAEIHQPRSLTKRVSGVKKESLEKVKRRQRRPLLRSNSHDSEEEWREKMREVTSDSDLEYQPRLRPTTPSADRAGRPYSASVKRKERHHRDDSESDELQRRMSKLKGQSRESDGQIAPSGNKKEVTDRTVRRYDDDSGSTDSDTELEVQENFRRVLSSQGDQTLTEKSPTLPRDPPQETLLLSGTYEIPVDSQKNKANFFREGEKQDEGEPIYNTIKSGGWTGKPPPDGETSGITRADEEAGGGPPALPPRGTEFENMTRAEKERFLYEYQRMKNENQREKAGSTLTENVDLPRKRNHDRKNDSRTCSIM